MSVKSRRVAYVIDTSGAMTDTFLYVKAELIKSLDLLVPQQCFLICLFREDMPIYHPENGRLHCSAATESAKALAKSWVAEIVTVSKKGMTDPLPCFAALFALPAQERPDAIFLLTNGPFPRRTIRAIGKMNPDRQVQVYTIGWVYREPEEQLKTVARQNGGRYVFVAEQTLGVEPLGRPAQKQADQKKR